MSGPFQTSLRERGQHRTPAGRTPPGATAFWSSKMVGVRGLPERVWAVARSRSDQPTEA